MIQVSELSKYYGEIQALERCSFRVPKGEIVGLVGKNGAGKTTALRILSGQMLPSAGEVEVDGQALSAGGHAIRARIGYLPETPPLYPEMSVAAYLSFACRLKRIERARVATRIGKVIRSTGLEGMAEHRLGTLARGYRQRVGIAQAIVHDPPVVLLDEPMSGLDPLQIVQIRDLILSLKPRHTVLFSSHILSEVTQICDRVILLDDGTVKAQGTEANLRRELLQRRTLSLAVRGDADELRQALGAIEGIAVEVRPSVGAPEGVVEARIVNEDDVRERVSRLCVEAGLGLLELREERHGLEELMLQLLEGGEDGRS